jgi:nicotinamidase-related amidase
MTTPSSDHRPPARAPEEHAADPRRTPDDTLLLCIDMQPVFIRAVADGDRVQRRCEFAVAAAHGLGLPVLFTEQVPEKLGGTAPTLRNLAPTAPLLAKRTFSALADQTIRHAVLGDAAVEHLLLCGIETSVCVYQTAIAALAQGLEVTIFSDCVSARRVDDARACLEALARSGAHILPSETVFYALLHDVSHPFFKTYTQLVKNAG